MNLSDSELQLINTKPMNKKQLINTKPMNKKKLKELLSELKMFKFQTILILECKKINDHRIFNSSTELITSDSDIDEAFISLHHSILKKTTKKYASVHWIVLYVIIKYSI